MIQIVGSGIQSTAVIALSCVEKATERKETDCAVMSDFAFEVPRNWISREIGTNTGKSDFGRPEDTDEPKILSHQVSANLGVNF